MEAAVIGRGNIGMTITIIAVIDITTMITMPPPLLLVLLSSLLL